MNNEYCMHLSHGIWIRCIQCIQNCHILYFDLTTYREVAKAVSRIIALSLDLESEFFCKPDMLGEPIAVLRLLHYEGNKQ